MICPECGGEFVAGVETCVDCGIALVPAEPESVADPAPVGGQPESSASADHWVVLLRTGRLFEADLAAATLEKEGIPYYRQEQDSSGLSFAMPVAPSAGPGTWWVIRVPEALAEKARAILEELPMEIRESPGVWDFGPTEKSKSFFKGWALLYLVLFALSLLMGLLSLLREF